MKNKTSDTHPKYPVQDNPRANQDTGNPNDKNKTPGTNPKQSDEPTSKESDPTRY